MRFFGCLTLALFAACVTTPRDPFRAGERALLADDLIGALVAYDAVPVSHLRYPEARAAASSVERRMRRGHEILLEGMLLRSEWRDREAVAQLRRAREVWPGLPGIDALIAATEHRLELFSTAAPLAQAKSPALLRPGSTATAPTEPRMHATAVPAPEESMPELHVAEPEVSAPEVMPVVVPESAPAEVAVREVPTPRRVEVVQPIDGSDLVAASLIEVERRLARGELGLAVADLLALVERYPEESRVRVRLVRVLHQRALVRYGQGALAGAIGDWQRVLELDPNHRLAASLLRAARAEAPLAVPPR